MIKIFNNLSFYTFEKNIFFCNKQIFFGKFDDFNLFFFVLRFKNFFTHFNSLSSNIINKNFYHLILKKWVFLLNNSRVYFFLYNYFAFKILYQSCLLITHLMRNKKLVLFISDDYLENVVSFRDLNYIHLPASLKHFSYLYGDYKFWLRESNDIVNSNFTIKNLKHRKFDLAVVLCIDYVNLKTFDFLGLSKFSLGFADLQTSSNLFTYFLPVLRSKFFSAQIFKEFIFFLTR